MKIAVTSWPGSATVIERLRDEFEGEVEVVEMGDEPFQAGVIITSEVDEEMEDLARTTPVILCGDRNGDRVGWLERGVELVPEEGLDEIVARCREIYRRVRPIQPHDVPIFDAMSSPMQPRRITHSTFQIISQISPGSVLGFYQLTGDGSLELFAESREGELPGQISGELPVSSATKTSDEIFAEASKWMRANGDLSEGAGDCYVASVESETRRYGLLVSLQPAGVAPPTEALAHAARQLAYGLEAAYLFSQVRRAYGRLRETRDQLVHAEKFAAVGLLAAEVAHEINNPASFVITNLSVLGDYAKTISHFHQAIRTATDAGLEAAQLAKLEEEFEIGFLEEDVETLIRRSLAGLERIHQIVQDLRFTSNVRSTSTGWVSVERLIEAAIGLVKHEAKFRARLVLDFGGVPMIDSDPNRLNQVFLNLLVNAVQAIAPGDVEGNEVVVSTRCNDQQVVVSIRDTGDGVPERLRKRIWEPFFTTKEPGDGTGLGLSISRDVVQALGGRLTFETEEGEGSTFEVSLPISQRGER